MDYKKLLGALEGVREEAVILDIPTEIGKPNIVFKNKDLKELIKQASPSLPIDAVVSLQTLIEAEIEKEKQDVCNIEIYSPAFRAGIFEGFRLAMIIFNQCKLKLKKSG